MAILMTYTNVSKPSSTSYTNENVVGKEQYDQPSLTYDSSFTFYDGFNEDLYTLISKPAPVISRRGETRGLLIPLTAVTSTLGTAYTFISKPN